MKLNKSKCIFLGMNISKGTTPKFQDGTKVKRDRKATYPGVTLTDRGNTNEEVNQIIKQTIITWKKMNTVWETDTCSKK